MKAAAGIVIDDVSGHRCARADHLQGIDGCDRAPGFSPRIIHRAYAAGICRAACVRVPAAGVRVDLIVGGERRRGVGAGRGKNLKNAQSKVRETFKLFVTLGRGLVVDRVGISSPQDHRGRPRNADRAVAILAYQMLDINFPGQRRGDRGRVVRGDRDMVEAGGVIGRGVSADVIGPVEVLAGAGAQERRADRIGAG